MLSKAFNTDTIAAIATASGVGGIGIVRASGELVPEIAQRVIHTLPAPRQATCCSFHDQAGNLLDQGLALYFPAPHSFTGESVLELQGHGGAVVLSLVLDALLAAGARLAAPGEFSERAFLNGKLDLAQAEGVADLIHSTSRAAAMAALQTLTGVFSEKIKEIEMLLMQRRIHLEALLNFPDEPVDPLHEPDLDLLIDKLQLLLAQAQEGKRLNDGLNMVLVGPPNSGKSSLMNWLSKKATSIVSETPGTTRDIVQAQIQLQGMPVQISDTAGLRDKTQDPIEQQGIARAKAALCQADLVVLVGVENEPTPVTLVPGSEQKLLKVCNKIDLTGTKPGYRKDTCYISIHQETGLAELIQAINSQHWSAGEGTFTARTRHLEALTEALHHLQAAAALSGVEGQWVILAEQLRLAHEALGRITGRISSEKLLGEIFSQFCIGK